MKRAINLIISLKSNIAYVLHQADLLATRVEYDVWNRSQTEEQEATKERVSSLKKSLTVDDSEKNPKQEEQLSKKSQDLFDELFGDKK